MSSVIKKKASGAQEELRQQQQTRGRKRKAKGGVNRAAAKNRRASRSPQRITGSIKEEEQSYNCKLNPNHARHFNESTAHIPSCLEEEYYPISTALKPPTLVRHWWKLPISSGVCLCCHWNSQSWGDKVQGIFWRLRPLSDRLSRSAVF